MRFDLEDDAIEKKEEKQSHFHTHKNTVFLDS